MQTSAKGIAALTLEEGEVLKSYRDVAGVWTIGVGITSAAGVGKIGPGMVITRAQSQNMLQQALRQSYEPAVAREMPLAKQQEFDAAVSFHWHTGAIARASWVKLWRAKAGRDAISKSFRQWNRADGRVLPALSRRRDRELEIMFDGVYRGAPAPVAPSAASAPAIWALPLSSAEMEAAITAFSRLGYWPARDKSPITSSAIQQFQSDHNLTPDGIIGRATLSTLQRRLDAARKAALAAPASAGVAGLAALPAPATVAMPWVDALAGAVLLAWVLWQAWHYRDAIAAKLNARLPRVAALLRRL